MKNPFKLFKPDNKDRVKQNLEANIKHEAWEITKLVAIRKATLKDVKRLEDLYKEYFKLYPDSEREKHSKERIKKLKQII